MKDAVENKHALRVYHILGKILVGLYFTFLLPSNPAEMVTESYFYFTRSEEGIDN